MYEDTSALVEGIVSDFSSPPPNYGTIETIKVRKTLTSGTARANRGVAAQCRQPNPKADKISKAKLDEIKAKPIEERMKTAMTTTEPRVICASVFDNGPVHMLDTIHTDVFPIAVEKPRWDAASKSVKKVAIRLMNLIHAYNFGMDEVDTRDHLGSEYGFDGHFWRDRKWWMPIFKELFKSSCDQGYVVYVRVCEIAEAKRKAAEAAAAAAAAAADAADAQAERAGAGSKPIKPMSHLDFMEKIAEGYVIEAYNSTKREARDHISLKAYDLQILERAISEMRGWSAASTGATGGSPQPPSGGSAGGKAPKRKLEVCACETLCTLTDDS